MNDIWQSYFKKQKVNVTKLWAKFIDQKDKSEDFCKITRQYSLSNDLSVMGGSDIHATNGEKIYV